MPAPLIEFATFAEPRSWLLKRGRPPWLDDARWYANALRASLMLGVMGTVTGWLTIGGGLLANCIDDRTGGQARWLSEVVLGFVCGPGLWFGLGVLIPLSRWLGRGWIMSFLVVPVSMLASYSGVMTMFFVSPIMAPSPDWIPGGREASLLYASVIGAAMISAWMGHPFKPPAWGAGLLAVLLAGVGCQVMGWAAEQQRQSSPALLPAHLPDALPLIAIYTTFQSLTAIGLGARLWKRNGSDKVSG